MATTEPVGVDSGADLLPVASSHKSSVVHRTRTTVGSTPTATKGPAAGTVAVSVSVACPKRPTHVRYTANQGFSQCAVYNADGLPLYPFSLVVEY